MIIPIKHKKSKNILGYGDEKLLDKWPQWERAEEKVELKTKKKVTRKPRVKKETEDK